MSSKDASHRKENICQRDEGKNSLLGGEELSKLLLQTMQSIKGDIKKMRREMCIRDSYNIIDSAIFYILVFHVLTTF